MRLSVVPFSYVLGSPIGFILIMIVGAVVLIVIARLFKIKLSAEDAEGCFAMVGWIALGVMFLAFLFNKCSAA